MQFISSLFGGEGNSLFTALFALGIVIVLIVLGVWLLKLVFNASGTIARGRNRRLSVIETLALDPKRQLLIVRRDNVEHLILTGGAHDIVVETGIAVSEASAQPARRPLPVAPRRPTLARPLPAPAESPEPGTPPVPAVARQREAKPASPAPKSLRHTGLMRPVPEPKPAVQLAQNSDQLDHDSAKQGAGSSSTGSTEFDEQGDLRRDERKADGN